MTEVTVNPLTLALAAFVKADKSSHDAGTSYMALAVADVWGATDGETVAANLVADMCRETGSVGKATKDFPNGKPNPQTLKANGYSGLAEGARLLKKIAKNRDNDAVANVVEGFLGIIQNEAAFEAHKAEDKRIVKALESGDDKRLAKAEAAYLTDYLALTYPERPTSFSALRRALDKATTATGSAVEEAAPTEGGEGEGEGETSVSDNAVVVVAADVLATADAATLVEALIGKLADASDADVDRLLAAIRDEVGRRADAEPMAAAA